MSDEEKPKIIIDEDWKSKVKAEDAELEAKLKQEQAASAADSTAPVPEGSEAKAPTENPEAGGEFELKDPEQLPPAEISSLVNMLVQESMVTLGVIPHPADGKPHFLPKLSKHFIDLLGVLEEKTKGNLTPEEASGIEQLLHQLRLTYVEQEKKFKS